MRRDLAQERPTVHFRRADGAEHLPAGVASLVRLRPRTQTQVWLYNDADEPVSLEVAGPAGEWAAVHLAPHETIDVRVQ